MKVTYTTKNGRLTFELEASTQADLFEQLASVQEVFEDLTCSKGGKTSDEVRFVVREVDDNKYYELRCVERGALGGAKKAFGQTKKGGFLFPKVKDAEGKYLPDNGWVKFNKETGKEE